jgi:hypothetical protein
MLTFFVNTFLTVAFSSRKVMFSPDTATLALNVSPGRTGRSTLTDGEGTSSYHAVYVGRPPAQSTSVPVCSSPLEPSLKPPSPTQNAVDDFPESQVTAGCFQLPETLVNFFAASADVTA